MNPQSDLMTDQILTVVALPEELSEADWGGRTKIIYTGVGKINTVMALMEAIRISKPRLVLNLGTAGAMHSIISGVVEVESVIERDFDAAPLCDRGLIPFEIGNNLHYSGHKGFVCASGDSFVRESDGFLKKMNVDIVDIELIAIARVCKKYNIPWRSFKFVSDYVGKNIAKQWESELSNASQALIRKFDETFYQVRP